MYIEFSFAHGDGLSDHNVDSGALPLEVPDDRAIGLNIK